MTVRLCVYWSVYASQGVCVRPGLCGNDYISLLQPYDWLVSVWFDSVCLGARG